MTTIETSLTVVAVLAYIAAGVACVVVAARHNFFSGDDVERGLYAVAIAALWPLMTAVGALAVVGRWTR